MLRLTDRPIRTKLALLLTPPIVVILVLSGVIAYGAAAAASRADEAHRLVGQSMIAGELAGALQNERAAAGLVFVEPSRAAAVTAYRKAADRTDTLAARFTARRLDALPQLREQVRGGQDVPASLVLFRYRAMIADLIGYRAGMGQLNVDADITTGLRASAALSACVEALGQMQITVLPTFTTRQLTAAGQQQVVAAAAAHGEALEDFRRLAPARWTARLATAPARPDVTVAEQLQALAANTPPGATLTWAVPPQRWVSAIGARMERLHTVERAADTELLRAVAERRDAQRRDLLVLAAAVLAALVALLATGWWISRSMTRSLRALTRGATATATTTLPDVVGRLTSGLPDATVAAALVERAGQAVAVAGEDEIGEVARAFNHVSRTAVSLAGDQAQLQAVIASVMEAIARQLQRQGHQVMAAIDALEQDEEDPARLRRLFELDQRATGIQRLIANLFVFAGGRAGQPVRRPIALPDVVKAAISRVDKAYDRVDDTAVDRSVQIVPEHAEEIVHVLTELVDNAVRFSPPGAPVRIEACHVGDRVHAQISDTGMGIPQSRLPHLVDRLATFRLDAETARHMGLPVVGRIAARLGLSVGLRSTGAGTRADVVIPATLFTTVPALAVAEPAAFAVTERPALAARGTATTLADAPPPRRRTANGLPVRVPGEHSAPAAAPGPSAPPTDRAAAGRGMAAFAASARLARHTPTQIGQR
ncbi:sensor histidine kinase [Actinoplanes sp. NPDC049802]|uniref:sensor histidine kinase n=1 Tax=Actinoplanes sp. NPDC049802 TaxID=3154742 RepID=UPI0034051F3F